MSQYNLCFETAMALFRRLPYYTAVDLDALGISQADLELVAGGEPWRRDQIDKAMRVLNAFIFGELEILRMPKFTVPAEFIAPIVAAAVGPCNQKLASIWLAQERQTGVGVDTLSQKGQTTTQIEAVSDGQLFALVCKLMASSNALKYRENFATAMGFQIQAAMDVELAGNTKPKGR